MADFIVRIRIVDEDLRDFAGPEELDLSLDARLIEVYDSNGDPWPFFVVAGSLTGPLPEEGEPL